MRHINKVGSISHAEGKRGRMESAGVSRRDHGGGSRRRRFLSAVPLRVMLGRRPADKKISGIAVLSQPDVNARTKACGT